MAKVKRRDLLKAGAALAAAGTLGKGFAQEFYASPPTPVSYTHLRAHET